jgi:alkylation response protein AidB-like acyl-CoA dehydrogenase
MDFSRVPLSDEDQDFLGRVRAFFDTHMTEDVLAHERETGDGFHEGVHLAIGAQGWLDAETKSDKDGGFTPVQRRVWQLEKLRERGWDVTATEAHDLMARCGRPVPAGARDVTPQSVLIDGRRR